MKRDKYDSVVSDIVRLRANFKCERCGTYDAEAQITFKSTKMDCSHFNGRGSGVIARYDSDNCRCLCKSCHSYLENKPGEHTRFLQKILGEGGYELLEERCRQIRKMYKSDKEEMYQHYKSEKQRLMEMRKNGDTDYIELRNYF